MKKKRLLLATLAALSACSLAFTFTACGETPPSGGDDSSQTTPGGTTPGGTTPGGTTPGGTTPVDPEPEKIDVGVFARKWVNAEQTLDLAAHTFTDANDFKVNAITGEGAETEISCTANAKDYVLKLNEDGKLEMYEKDAAEGTDPAATFMPDATPLAGAWEVGSWTYLAVSSVLNEDGGFDVASYSAFNESESFDEDVAYTSLTFDEDNHYTLSLLATGTDYLGEPYIRCGLTVDSESNFKVYDDFDEEFIDTAPFEYTCADSYLTEQSKLFTFDKDNETVVYTGTEVKYELTSGAFGAGYAFTVEGKEYVLSRQAGSIHLIAEGNTLALAINDPSAIIGEWANGKGNIIVTVNEDLSVELLRYGIKTTVDMQPSYNAGAVKYTFTTSSHTNTIKSILGDEGQIIEAAITIESTDSNLNGYFVKADARDLFYGTYTDNLNTLVVGDDQSINITNKLDDNEPAETYAGEFTYNEDLECIVLAYAQGSPYSLAIAGDGVLWTLAAGQIQGDDQTYYMNESTWLNDEAEELFEQAFTKALQSDSDIYTSGVNGTTVKFDFTKDVKEVIFNDTAYRFLWDSDISVMNNITPQLFFMRADDQTDNNAYNLHATGNYLSLTSYDIDSYEEGDTLFLVSEAKFESHFGTTYVYRGPFFDEIINIDNDGKFFIHTTDLTNSDSAVVFREYRYVLMDSEELGFTFAFEANEESQIHMFVYIKDRIAASLADIEYIRDDLAPFTGTYYAANGKYVEVSASGKVIMGTYFEETVTPPAPPGPPAPPAPPLPFSARSLTPYADDELSAPIPNNYTVESGVLTAEVKLGEVVYTLTVNGTTATLVEKDDTTNSLTLSKRAFDLFAFVGNYEIDEDVISVSLSTFAANMPPALKVTLNGSTVTHEIEFDVAGKQILTFSYLDFSTFKTYKYKLTLDGTTLTLSKDTETKTVTSAGIHDYSAFAFAGTKTYVDENDEEHDLLCLSKTDGKTPLYILDDQKNAASLYSIRVAKDGTLRMTVEAGIYTIEITNDNGVVSVGVVRPDPVDPIPGPPAPPAPPAPPLP